MNHKGQRLGQSNRGGQGDHIDEADDDAERDIFSDMPCRLEIDPFPLATHRQLPVLSRAVKCLDKRGGRQSAFSRSLPSEFRIRHNEPGPLVTLSEYESTSK